MVGTLLTATANQHIPCLPKTPKKDRERWPIFSTSLVINTMANWRLCPKTTMQLMYRVSSSALHCELLNYLEAIKNRHICTSSCWSFWWPPLAMKWCFVTAEHHAWEFFNSFHVLLVLVNSRPANCDSLMELGQSSTSTNYSRFPEACLKRRNSCALKYFGVLHLVLSRRKLSCEQFSSPFSLTTFTTHSSSVETGT